MRGWRLRRRWARRQAIAQWRVRKLNASNWALGIALLNFRSWPRVLRSFTSARCHPLRCPRRVQTSSLRVQAYSNLSCSRYRPTESKSFTRHRTTASSRPALASTIAQPCGPRKMPPFRSGRPIAKRLAFFWRPTSKTVGSCGGPPQVLAQNNLNPNGGRGGSWNADGVILFTPNDQSPLFRVSASGGEAMPVTKLDKQTSHRFPLFLPGGRQFLFFVEGAP